MIKLKNILNEQQRMVSKATIEQTKSFANDVKSKGKKAQQMLSQKIANKMQVKGYTLFTNGTISKVKVSYNQEAEFKTSPQAPHLQVVITNNKGKSILGKNWKQKGLTKAQGGTDYSPNATADSITAYYIKQLLPWVNQANKNNKGSAIGMENEVRAILKQSGLAQSIANFINSLRTT